MIPVISLLDLKHRTYIPNLISNYSFYCKQITTVHEISGDVPLAGVLTCHSQWTLNNAVNYENKQAPQHKKEKWRWVWTLTVFSVLQTSQCGPRR